MVQKLIFNKQKITVSKVFGTEGQQSTSVMSSFSSTLKKHSTKVTR